jgi:hypothetical protein
MKTLLIALLLPAFAFAGFECPAKPAAGAPAAEAAEDCPWAGAARLLAEAAAAGKGLDALFSTYAPAVPEQLAADRANKAALKLWGVSINFDELANGEIVNPAVLSWLSARAGAPAPEGRLMHAGLEHTYGYLFSVLPTKFGFKRARWVRADIGRGLGLPDGVIAPEPSSGTLLANVTCVAGAVALRDDAPAAALLKEASRFCAAPAAAWRPDKRLRLTETLNLQKGRTVALRTDFVPFGRPQGGNSHLLVYSVLDSAAGPAHLITAFPVNEGFVKSALNPDNLGENKPVQTRYNAHVAGVTGAGRLAGSRRALALKD